MKTAFKLIFRRVPGVPLSRAEAWGCLIENQLMCPGLGSWVAGRQKSGGLQLVLTCTGFCLFVFGAVALLAREFREMEMPPLNGPEALIVYRGFGLVAASWIWSLISSCLIIRGTAANEE